MIGSVLLKMPDMPQLDAADSKRAYVDSEARDGHGRWTGDGSANAATTSETVADQTAVADLAPETIGLVARLAGVVAGPITLAAATLIPTNQSNIHSGEFPDFPGLHYRSDEGVVTISRLDAAGNIETLYHGVPDADGFYHDNAGYVVGQRVGTGVMFDNEALSDFAAKPATETADARLDPVLPSDDDEMKCPAPTPENIKGRSNRSLAYQEQVTGLRRGWDVNYLGVRFDGCDEDTGRMIEAKGLGMEWMLTWPPKNVYQSKFYLRMMRQAERQNTASAGRGDDYYFASDRMANFFGVEFRKAGYSNIRVHYVEAIVKKIVAWLSSRLAKQFFVH
jgi:hypothetical protein